MYFLVITEDLATWLHNSEILFSQDNYALTLDRTRSQWVDFGNHTEACVTRPETCGTAGGAISLWVKVIVCPLSWCGIITSRDSVRSGSAITCNPGYIGYGIQYLSHRKRERVGWSLIIIHIIGLNKVPSLTPWRWINFKNIFCLKIVLPWILWTTSVVVHASDKSITASWC